MNVVAILMVRDEADVIGFNLEHLLAEQVDRIVVADNRSVDDTRKILDDYAARFSTVSVVDDPVVGYSQNLKMTALARAHCAVDDWVVPVDADELWFATDGRPLGDMLRDCPAGVVAAAPLVHVPHPDTDDVDDVNPFTRIRRRVDRPEANAKVAFRWGEAVAIDMGNHGVAGTSGHRLEGAIQVRHFQYRTLEQVRRKVTNGVEAVNQMAETYCAHWRSLAALDAAGLEAWWDDYCLQDTVLDPAPWSRCMSR